VTVLFSIHCTTCEARLSVRDASLVGQILACPKCGSMVQIMPPDGGLDEGSSASDDAETIRIGQDNSDPAAETVRAPQQPSQPVRREPTGHAAADSGPSSETPSQPKRPSPGKSNTGSGSRNNAISATPRDEVSSASSSVWSQEVRPYKARSSDDSTAIAPAVALTSGTAADRPAEQHASFSDEPTWATPQEVQWQRRLFLGAGLLSLGLAVAAVLVLRTSSEQVATDHEVKREITTDATAVPEVKSTEQVASADPTLESATLSEAPEQTKEQRIAAARQTQQQQQGQLVEGLHLYHDETGAFPADAAGLPQLAPSTRLSWLAQLLPYYEHPDWHEQLNFRRSWNDPQNEAVARQPLNLVLNPLVNTTKTDDDFPVSHYVGMTGLGSDAAELPLDDPRAGMFGTQRRVTRDSVRDGLSNTIAVIGVSDKLGPWAAGGKPTTRGLTSRPYINGPDGFGSGLDDGVIATMADGSVRYLSADIDPVVLEQLATINGSPQPAAEVRPVPFATDSQPDAPATAKKESEPAAEPVAGVQKADSPPIAPAQIERRLALPLEKLEFVDVALAEFVEFLAQLTGVSIELDTDALAEGGITPEQTVTVELSEATAQKALSHVIDQLDLTLRYDNERIVITMDPQLKPQAKARP